MTNTEKTSGVEGLAAIQDRVETLLMASEQNKNGAWPVLDTEAIHKHALSIQLILDLAANHESPTTSSLVVEGKVTTEGAGWKWLTQLSLPDDYPTGPCRVTIEHVGGGGDA